ncbi:unnamed protein product, partial [Trichogramma brassicae]
QIKLLIRKLFAKERRARSYVSFSLYSVERYRPQCAPAKRDPIFFNCILARGSASTHAPAIGPTFVYCSELRELASCRIYVVNDDLACAHLLSVRLFKDVTARLDLAVKVSRGTATDVRPRWMPAISGLSACQEQLVQCRASRRATFPANYLYDKFSRQNKKINVSGSCNCKRASRAEILVYGSPILKHNEARVGVSEGVTRQYAVFLQALFSPRTSDIGRGAHPRAASSGWRRLAYTTKAFFIICRTILSRELDDLPKRLIHWHYRQAMELA